MTGVVAGEGLDRSMTGAVGAPEESFRVVVEAEVAPLVAGVFEDVPRRTTGGGETSLMREASFRRR